MPACVFVASSAMTDLARLLPIFFLQANNQENRTGCIAPLIKILLYSTLLERILIAPYIRYDSLQKDLYESIKTVYEFLA